MVVALVLSLAPDVRTVRGEPCLISRVMSLAFAAGFLLVACCAA